MEVQPIVSPMIWRRGFHTSLKNDIFMECAVTNQEDIMICERCGGLKVFDHFYGTAIDVSAWMYDGLRCVNCGSITALMRGEGDVYYAPRTERSGRPALCGQAVAGRYGDAVSLSVSPPRHLPEPLSSRIRSSCAISRPGSPRVPRARRTGVMSS